MPKSSSLIASFPPQIIEALAEILANQTVTNALLVKLAADSPDKIKKMSAILIKEQKAEKKRFVKLLIA